MVASKEKTLPNPWKMNPYALESNESLLKIRLLFYLTCMIHITWLAVELLPLDITESEDEQLLAMARVRHLLYTAWTNYFQLVYFPLSFYVDYKELKGKHRTPLLEKLRTLRNFFFCSIVCPSTLYAGCFFWRMWFVDRSLLVPDAFDEYVPAWMHHNMHTVTVLVCLVDLLLVPRLRPDNSQYETLAIRVLCSLYAIMILLTHDVFGIWVYPFFAKLTPWRMVVYVFSFFVEHYFFHYSQWLIVELYWGTKGTRN